MAGLCQTYLDDIDAGYLQAQNDWWYLTQIIAWMNTYIDIAPEHNWRFNVIGAFGRVQSALYSIIYGSTYHEGDFRVPYFLRNCAGAVDMDGILSAMLGATFNQLQNFIGIEDAYRVALWNAPFNADFYAALARGFMKWP